MEYPEKLNKLIDALKKHNGLAIAFSGGVDSTFLLAAASMAIPGKVMAITVKTPYIPEWEIEEAMLFCKGNSVNHLIIETGIPESIRNNPENRCYLCKHHLFTLIKEEAAKNAFFIVIDGTNADDLGVYRPGLAALRELKVVSPLLEHGITKAEVREYAAILGLKVADKPAYACLLTRLPYNYEIKTEELTRIAAAEQFLFSFGYRKARVRNHGNIARIEIEKDKIPTFVSSGETEILVRSLKELGYQYITLDMEGFRSGSFDKNLNLTA